MRKKPHSTHLFVNIRLLLVALAMLTNRPSAVNNTVDDAFASLEGKDIHTYYLDIFMWGNVWEIIAVPILTYMELKLSMQNRTEIAEPWNITVLGFFEGVITLILYICV